MNLTKQLTLALVALAAVAVSRAQQPTGLLGQTYADFNLHLAHESGFSSDTYGGDLGFNVPICKYADIGASYGYMWNNSGVVKANAHTLLATVTTYPNKSGAKPFAFAQVGHEWFNAKILGDKMRELQGLWGLGVGVEVPAGFVTLTPKINYQDDMNHSSISSGGGIVYSLEANHWFNSKVGVYSYVDFMHKDVDMWSFALGVRMKL